MKKKLKNSSLFSESEQKVLQILGRKRMSMTDLTILFYDDEVPPDAGIKVGNFVRRIVAKCRQNKLDWTIKGSGAGRHGRTIWKEDV